MKRHQRRIRTPRSYGRSRANWSAQQASNILLNSGYVKIGIAANPKARLQDINIGSPVPAVIAATRIYSLRVHAREAELTLHRQFKDRHASGEWFAVPLEEAVAALLALPEAA